jgi:hypothetical protein
MLNNEFKFIGVALTNYEVVGKVSKFKIEVTKQKSGETYEIELVAYNNSKSINFNENIKGKLVAVIGFVAVTDGKIQLNVTNVMSFSSGYTRNTGAAPAVPVVTSNDLENQDIEISDDDLPF